MEHNDWFEKQWILHHIDYIQLLLPVTTRHVTDIIHIIMLVLSIDLIWDMFIDKENDISFMPG